MQQPKTKSVKNFKKVPHKKQLKTKKSRVGTLKFLNYFNTTQKRFSLYLAITVIVMGVGTLTYFRLSRAKAYGEECLQNRMIQINSESQFANAIDNYIRTKYPSSKFLNIGSSPAVGKAFISAGKNNNVNPILLVGISAAESTVATSTGYDMRLCNNAFGRTDPSGSCKPSGTTLRPFYKYSSWSASMLNEQAAFVNRVYGDLTTFAAFLERYSPKSDNPNRDTTNCSGAACGMRNAYLTAMNGIMSKASSAVKCSRPYPTVNIITPTDKTTLPKGTTQPKVSVIASSPNGRKVKVAYKLRKGTSCNLLVQTSVGPKDAWSEFGYSGSTFYYNFKNLSSGTYYWTAKAQDDYGNTSSTGLSFCGTSDWASAKTFTIP